jgi:hypothetical protein
MLLGAALAVSACSDDSAPTGPDTQYATIQLNTASGPQYVTLGATATLATVADASTNTAWDLAFTSVPTVAVNGGASGPGGVKAFCLCANASLTLSQIEAITPQAAADAFGAVSSASIPADASFVSDDVSLAITGWYDYNRTTHAITANGNTWGIRMASTAGAFAKFQVAAIPTPTQANAGPVTIKWAVQSSASATLGADQSLVVDLSSGAKVYVNLTTGATSTTAPAAWDIALQGYSITLNTAGNVAAVPLVPSSFYTSYELITQIPVGAQGIPSNAFSTDGTGGAFVTSEPYRYDPTSHQIYPTYDVYLVKRGADVYKVQVVSYYSTGGTFGVLTVRYAKLTD